MATDEFLLAFATNFQVLQLAFKSSSQVLGVTFLKKYQILWIEIKQELEEVYVSNFSGVRVTRTLRPCDFA